MRVCPPVTTHMMYTCTHGTDQNLIGHAAVYGRASEVSTRCDKHTTKCPINSGVFKFCHGLCWCILVVFVVYVDSVRTYPGSVKGVKRAVLCSAVIELFPDTVF